ncbi:MAG: SulP family inorganic anion transporter [Myxococcota bacterium]|nr:SulP family inorganic anion transporter [Myxococcota bacterium]
MSSSVLRDLGASVVVFLVALPLCLGVAIASGAPPALGIVSGIVGGIVVGAFAGSPLQVSGPAAGLIVSVWAIVDGWGLAALGWAVVLSGAVQLLAAGFKLGRWFRAVSPALIGGMLAGIGTLIATSQLHVMVGATPPSGGVASLIALPQAWLEQLATAGGAWAAALGLGTIALLFLWDRFKPKRLAMIPGPLVAVAAATAIAALFQVPVAKVQLPASLTAALNVPAISDLSLFTDLGFVGAALALGLIAAAEALLCANATDQLHDGPPTSYDKELFALGLGNVVAGALGALPVTGVIVRSAANIQAGATTRRAAIVHGFLLLGLVALAPAVLGLIPVAVLAGVLVYVGGKLLAPEKAMALHRAGNGELWGFLATVGAIFVMGLLTGILVGLGVSLLKLLYTFSHMEVEVTRDGDRYDVDVHGAATFVQLPKLAEALEAIPEDAEVHVHIGALAYVDHACAELLHRQEERRERAGGELITEWDEVKRLQVQRPLLDRSVAPAEALVEAQVPTERA